MNYRKIPNEFTVGGQKMEVKSVERCEDNSFGQECIAAGYVQIAEKFNKDQVQTETSKINTFYHELTHCILDTMGESELSRNEKFVCCFAGFLTEAMKNAYFFVPEYAEKEMASTVRLADRI